MAWFAVSGPCTLNVVLLSQSILWLPEAGLSRVQTSCESPADFFFYRKQNHKSKYPPGAASF